MSAAMRAVTAHLQAAALEAVQAFNVFPARDAPYQVHHFGCFALAGKHFV
jgi:hypothetical protein